VFWRVTTYPVGNEDTCPGAKEPQLEAEHSQTSSGVKIVWSYTSIPPLRHYVFMTCCLIKQQIHVHGVMRN